MVRVRAKYRRYAEGGAVPDDAPAPDGSSVLKDQLAAMATANEAAIAQPQASADAPPVEMQLPPLAVDWLKRNPRYLESETDNSRLQALHWQVLADDPSLEPYGERYFREIERRENSAPDPQVQEYSSPGSGNRLRISADVDNVGARSRGSIVSAAPSREPPSSGGTSRHMSEGKITLSREQKEAAKISGLSEQEYAFQLMRLREAKARGDYQGRP